MSTLIRQFYHDHKYNIIRIYLFNGFQIRGKILDVDEHHLKFETSAYDGTSKEILVAISAITTFVPL